MEEDQEKYLEDARKVVKEQAYFMKKALNDGSLREGLKHSSTMLGELKTSLLSPKNYYILFMQIFDEMRVLEAYFKEEYRRGRKMSDLYENVQHAGAIVPRLYLLITVGSVYISTHEIPAKDILSDLMEMIKGVQHPIKGLFLRYYFLKMCKDKLPDKGSEYEGEGGDINDAVNCILNNLGEMNKLWVKMQSSSSKEKTRREKERNDLKVTIGENLVRLSQLEGCTINVYKEVVLDKLIEIISLNKDVISQQYLMDCIIQAFPDEYHLHSLEKILQTCAVIMQNGVDIKTIFIRLMDRLADFAANPENNIQDIHKDLDIFSMFKNNIDKIIQEQGSTMELKKFLELQVAFLNFSIRCYPNHTQNVNQILESCCLLCQKQVSRDLDEESQKSVVKLLTLPLETMSTTILSMNEYPNLMKYLPFMKRRTVALKISQAVVHNARPLTHIELTNQLVQFLTPLLREDKDYIDPEPYEFEEEQQTVARLVHLIYHHNPDQTYEMILAFRKEFLEGGIKRMKYTIPSLAYAYFRLARHMRKCNEWHENPVEEEAFEDMDTIAQKKLFNVRRSYANQQFKVQHHALFEEIKQLIDKIYQNFPEIALKLYLELILCVNEVDHKKELDEYTYEIATHILMIYQDEIADADAKNHALTVITGAFYRLVCLGNENYDTLIANTTQYSAKLLKKSEQCIAILKCTHLFYSEGFKEEKKVLECFKKVLKLADVCWNAHATNKHLLLYVSILNKFVYFLNLPEFQGIKIEDVQKCVDIIKSKKGSLANEAHNDELEAYFEQTCRYIEYRKTVNPKFQAIQI